MRCAVADHARHTSIIQLGEDMTINKLLYSQKGIDETERIWKELERSRKKERERRNENIEEENRERWWGWGGLERE